MDIKTTLVSNKSTDGSNHSKGPSNQRIVHTTAPIKHPVAPKGNPGKIAIKPEWAYDNNGATGYTDGKKGVAPGSFKPHNSRSTASGVFQKHPFKKSDPAARCC